MEWLSCLDRKLVRDVIRLRSQVLAIALVIACGVGQFITNRMSYDALRITQSVYYDQSRFADVFVSLKRAPLSGVFWMGNDALAAAFDLEGAFNNASIKLTHGQSESPVLSEIDRILQPYGGLGAYGRSEQVSNRFLSDEINQNRIFGTVIPGIFMAVAAFLISTISTRLVRLEREQIAILKAFGFTNYSIAAHYMKFCTLVVSFGSAIGGLRSGAPGEPMPRDLSMKEESEKILQSLPRFSPAFELYDALRKHAEESAAAFLVAADSRPACARRRRKFRARGAVK